MVNLVSENSPEDLKRVDLEKRITILLRDLTANLMRVTRRAGKPHRVEADIRALADLLDEYRALTGRGLSSSCYISVLDLDHKLPDDIPIKSNADHAVDSMVLGALQVAASKLVDQPMQEQRGRDQLIPGTVEWENRAVKPKRGQRNARKPKAWPKN